MFDAAPSSTTTRETGPSVAATSGSFQQVYDSYGCSTVTVSFDYAPTRLGITTGNTTCPNGEAGPCSL